MILTANEIMSILLKIDFVKSNHFNLITVNSVFIGFLFTSLSILMGFLNESIVQLFEEANALKKVYDNIQKGILFSLGSICISIVNLTIIEKYVSNTTVIKSFYSLELSLLLITLYFLFITIQDLKVIVDSIRIEKLKIKKNNEANKELESLLADQLKKSDSNNKK
ncbi:hypothetical protein CLACE_04910 [Clostridium acetobutylicum]|nr:hypothetical protein CLACE_04910 [Clostridium acetobutylicum]OOM09583.1 hypothetical protein CLABU_00420 [Clostridium acetobutylicum]